MVLHTDTCGSGWYAFQSNTIASGASGAFDFNDGFKISTPSVDLGLLSFYNLKFLNFDFFLGVASVQDANKRFRIVRF